MASTKFQSPAVATAAPSAEEWLCRLMCWFAAFPYAAYTQILTPSSRVRVMTNGLAVIVSPLVFTMALLTNGAALVGQSPYLYLLPVVAFAIDRLLIAISYTLASSSAWLTVVRALILAISLSMALLAGLLSESKNLLQRLHQREDAVTLQDAEAQNLVARLKAIDEQIARNEKELMTRDAIEAERLDAIRLRDMECHGKGGVDPKTGTIIKGGGKCGVNAETHRINAEAAEARLTKLIRLDNDNIGLATQRGKLKADLNTQLESQRSPADSVASLGRALSEADFQLWSKIFILILCVMTAEAFAFIMSEVPVPQTLQSAVRFSEEIDQVCMQAWREAAVAEVAKQRTGRRTQAADGLAPLEVTLAAAPTKPDATGERQRTETKTAELV